MNPALVNPVWAVAAGVVVFMLWYTLSKLTDDDSDPRDTADIAALLLAEIILAVVLVAGYVYAGGL